MKAQTKKRLKLFLILYLVLVLVAAVSTVGWFVFNRDVNIKNGVSVTTGNYLRVAIGDSTQYGEQATYTPEEGNLVDITGDGKDLYWPKRLLDETDKPPEDADFTKLEDEKAAGYYIVFDVHLRATQNMDVYLGQASKVEEVEPITGQEKYDRQSLYGQISADAIAGAARVAILEVTIGDGGEEQEELKQVWIPNPEYHLDYVENEATFDKSGTMETYRYYKPKADADGFELATYTAEDYLEHVSVGINHLATPSSATVVDGKTVDTPAMSNGAPILCSFTDAANEPEKTLRVRLWFEGTDREADKAVNGGLVNYTLQFVGIAKEACPAEREAALKTICGEWRETNRRYKLFFDTDGSGAWESTQGDTYVNTAEALENYGARVMYSTNGISWEEVNPTRNGDGASEGYFFSAGQKLYLKFRETETEKESSVYEYTLPER